MPTFKNIILPEVVVNHPDENLGEKLVEAAPSAEETMELVFYLNREKAKAAAEIDAAVKALQAHMAALYAKRKQAARTRTESTAGMVTYTEAGTKDVIEDRDKLVEALTPEQIRASYSPDLKALRTILPKKTADRLIKQEKTNPKLSYRDAGGEFEHF